MLRPYEKLSRVYDEGWGDFSIQYTGLINELLQERGIERARILDIACGTGILALELARGGHIVHGIDISPQMIAAAKKKAIGQTGLTFEVRDMSRFSLENRYDLAVCSFDSINYLLRKVDVRRMFRCVAQVLDEGGVFIFDSNTKYLYRSHKNDVFEREINGEEFLHQCNYDSRRRIYTTSFSFSDGTFEVHRQRPYSYDELSPLLEKTGFKVINLYSWFEKLPYSDNTPKFFCVAEKTSGD